MNWVRFFIGTPQNLVRTLVGLTVLYALVNPTGFQQAIIRLVGTIWQLFILALILAIIWHVVRRMVRL